MPKEKNECKDLSFAECELAILRMAVDKAEEKMGRRVVNSEDVQKIECGTGQLKNCLLYH